MEDKRTVTIKHYDYFKKETVIDHENLSVGLIAKSLSPEQFTELLSDYINSYSIGAKSGKEIGLAFRYEHRTLQGCLYTFLLGILCGLSEQEYSDARNEQAIKGSKKIAKMLENGELPYQMFI